MSGERALMTAGNPLVDVDLQRMADAAAGADEILDEALFTSPRIGTSGAYSKRVIPLVEESSASASMSPALGYINPRVLVIPKGSGASNVRPCRIVIGQEQVAVGAGDCIPQLRSPVPNGVATAASVGMSVTIPQTTAGPQHANGDPTNPRWDVIYALVQRSVTVSATRLVKDPVSGLVSTQAVSLASDVSVTIGVQAGTPAGSPVVPALPADTSTAWYVPLANVKIPANFNAGTTALGAGGSFIQQAWSGAWISPTRVRQLGRWISAPGSSGAALSATMAQGGDRRGNEARIEVAIVTPTTGMTNRFILDASRDWRFRAIRVVAMRPISQGGSFPYPSPEAVANAASPAGPYTSASFDTGWMFSSACGASAPGAAGVATQLYQASNGTPSATLNVWIEANGELSFAISTAPGDATHGDNWWFRVEASEQFLTQQV